MSSDEINKAVTLLEELAGIRPPPKGVTPLSPSDLPSTEGGVAFVFQTSGGIVVAATHGDGFLINKLPGPGAWSAPLFYTVNKLGVGLALGYKEVDSLLVLPDHRAVDAFSEEGLSGGVGADMAVGQSTTSALNYDMLASTYGLKEFSVAKGLMLDASLKGSVFRLDDERNEKWYGPVSRSDILAGKVPPPPAFQPVYDTLNAITGQKPLSGGGS